MDSSERLESLDQIKFIDMGSLTREFSFSIVAQGVRQGSNSLIGWLIG